MVSAVEDVIKLRDGIAAFNADWHAARMLWVTWWRVLVVMKIAGGRSLRYVAKKTKMCPSLTPHTGSRVSAALFSRDVGDNRVIPCLFYSPSTP